MASFHIITRAQGGLRIPNVTVRLRTAETVPLGCNGWPGTYDVTLQSDARGVADFNLGDLCATPFQWTSYISAETPKGRTAAATWPLPNIQYFGDYITTIEIPGAFDEGSAGAEAADAWARAKPWIIGGALIAGAIVTYVVVKRATTPEWRERQVERASRHGRRLAERASRAIRRR